MPKRRAQAVMRNRHCPAIWNGGRDTQACRGDSRNACSVHWRRAGRCLEGNNAILESQGWHMTTARLTASLRVTALTCALYYSRHSINCFHADMARPMDQAIAAPAMHSFQIVRMPAVTPPCPWHSASAPAMPPCCSATKHLTDHQAFPTCSFDSSRHRRWRVCPHP
jgi:hypothetical protein